MMTTTTTSLWASLQTVTGVLCADVTIVLRAATEAEAIPVLRPGTRVCFTGSALDRDGLPLSREEMEALAARVCLEPVSNATQVRCDVVVVAEPGTHSTNARNAQKWERPILSAAEFLTWARGPGPG